MSQWLVVVLFIYMIENSSYNKINDPEIKKAALRMEAADTEAVQKEQEYQAEQNVWWRKLLKKVRSSQGEVKSDVETVLLKIKDEEVECELIDFNKLDFSQNNPEVRLMRKSIEADMYLTNDGDVFSPIQDGSSPIIMDAGYPVIKNPGEEPYPFYNDGETKEDALKRFNETYQETEEGSGKWIKKESFKVIPVKKATAIRPSWNPTGVMGTKIGGVVAEGGYTITPDNIKGNPGAQVKYEFVD